MAREHARVFTRIWSDLDWRKLPPLEQRLYFLLLSQGNVTQAGVMPLQVRKWAKGSDYTTEEEIAATLASLAEHRFVVVDEDTEEVLIRSFIRNDGVLKIPNVFKAALKAALAVESPKLRKALAAELRRLRRKDANTVADELFPIESVTPPEPIPNSSRINPEPVKDRDEFPEPRGEGVGVGEGEPLAGGSVGGSRTPASTYPREAPPTEQRPPARCRKHLDHADPPPCRGCATAREAAEAWDAQQRHAHHDARSAEARQRAADRAAAIANCALCDPAGYIGTQLCDHDPDATARAARGRALVEAELAARRTTATQETT
ncbi:hypothetical protein ABZ215_13735 [Amycolatopsis sp. NPDC006131]|uniref:hypothetical protein n=1 Tax=Amycolatopsis sp. NPDC006131 TaxID=3156731 RepID=UPI0033B3D721